MHAVRSMALLIVGGGFWATSGSLDDCLDMEVLTLGRKPSCALQRYVEKEIVVIKSIVTQVYVYC